MRVSTLGFLAWAGALCAPDAGAIVVTSDLASHVVQRGTGLDGVGRVRFDLPLTGGLATCTGTLMPTGRHVLTAGHCMNIDGDLVEQASVFFHGPDSTVEMEAVEISIYPDYRRFSPFGFQISDPSTDLAILRLAEDAPDFVDRFELYTASDELGQLAQLVGYGRIGTGDVGAVALPEYGVSYEGENRIETTGAALNALVPIVGGTGAPFDDNSLLIDFDNGNPAQDAGSLVGLPDLGVGAREVNSARGDSGGPLLLDGRVAGVLSNGYAFSLGFFNGGPDVDSVYNSSFGELSAYTRVSTRLDWINSQLYRVPAADSWALMLAGLPGLLLGRRRLRN